MDLTKLVELAKNKKTWIGLGLAIVAAVVAYLSGLLGGKTPAPATPPPATASEAPSTAAPASTPADATKK